VKKHSVVYLCNALDEDTKNLRSITTDSPAATKKVFGLCHALQAAGVSSLILSMGRGRQRGSGECFSRFTKVADGIEITYASFWHIPFLTHIVTLFSLAVSLWMIKRKMAVKLLVYNRSWHYFLAVLFAKILRIPCYLDLEDGWTSKPSIKQKILIYFYDLACNSGSLLACEALKKQVKTTINLVCYGISSTVQTKSHPWQSKEKIQILFGGSLCEGTGVNLFMQAVQILMQQYPTMMKELHIVVVGFGEMAKSLESFSLKTGGLVEFLGAVSNDQYARLLGDSHVGLCLKLTGGPFHNSTFPSKVIEISSHGLLLLSTPVSDVPNIFSLENAVLLEDDAPESLANALCWLVQHKAQAENIADKGRVMARDCFSIYAVGFQLAYFFRDARAV